MAQPDDINLDVQQERDFQTPRSIQTSFTAPLRTPAEDRLCIEVRTLLVEQNSFVQKRLDRIAEQMELLLNQATSLSAARVGGTEVVDVTNEIVAEVKGPSCGLEIVPDQLEELGKTEQISATWKQHQHHHAAAIDRDEVRDVPHVAKCRHMIASQTFDLAVGAIILINVCFTCVGLEWKGQYYAGMLGLRTGDVSGSHVAEFFQTTETVFNGFYAVELCLRLWAYGRAFITNHFQMFDASVVVLSCIDSFVFRPLETAFLVDISTFRILRILRCFRMAKLMRLGAHVREMRVLVLTIFSCVRGVSWGMVLLAIIILGGAIFVMQISMTMFEDESLELQHRQWLFEKFGTTSRSMFTMFECTFSSAWVNYARRTIEEISSSFVLFWVVYIVFVNFAVMRVVGAIILKQTLDVAGIDAERIAMEKMKAKEHYASILHELFTEVDTSRDGSISKDEFESMLLNERVMQLFEQLDLEFDEMVALFGVMSADDGKADYEELLDGATKMKSGARTIDTIHILHSQMQISRELKRVSADVNHLRARFLGSPTQHQGQDCKQAFF